MSLRSLCRIRGLVFVVVVVVFVLPVTVIARDEFGADSIEKNCLFEDTCERCLSAHIDCAWCTDKFYDFRYRCLTRAYLLAYNCSEASIYGNEPEMDVLEDTPVKDYENVNDHAVQVQPQRAFMKLVKSHSESFKLTYRPAHNNPLDLYVLMDLTWSMRDDKETLTKLGAQLAEALRNLTSNFRLGFGSFADKPEMPMIMPHLRDNPCAVEREVCEPTYGFRHHLALTDDVRAFVDSVNASRVTGNLDNLEGGFDALMQVLVCPDTVGWKEEARKIVILVTDGFMHFAGDGLLAGITRRNDKSCHLNEAGEYLGSLTYDYPSLEEIYRELLQRKVSVIFAVTKNVVATYEEMQNLMKEITGVEILSEDSSNILELIRTSYERFITRTQFTDNSPPYIDVEYETDCGDQFATPRKRNYCNDLQLGKEVDFKVTVTLKDFPPDGVYKHKIRIEESSINEYMEIEVDIQKPCPCQEVDIDEKDEYRRFHCNDHGTMSCGMCQCDEGWTGLFCNCNTDSTNATTNEAIEKQCRQPYGSSTVLGPICSKHGECECGTCFCLPGFMGKYCECLECIACDLERANCECGQCVCKAGWSGPNCECTESVDMCTGPTGEVCSQRGVCQCGACVCQEQYRGRLCEIDIEGTDNKLCAFYEPCVTCLIEQYVGLGVCENITDICSSAEKYDRFTHLFVSNELDHHTRCLVRTKDHNNVTCDHHFTYQNSGGPEHYLVIKANKCAPVNVALVFGGLILATVLLGLAILLLFRLCVYFKDRSEYARFEQAQEGMTLCEQNRLYKDPVKKYEVPKDYARRNTNPFL